MLWAKKIILALWFDSVFYPTLLQCVFYCMLLPPLCPQQSYHFMRIIKNIPTPCSKTPRYILPDKDQILELIQRNSLLPAHFHLWEYIGLKVKWQCQWKWWRRTVNGSSSRLRSSRLRSSRLRSGRFQIDLRCQLVAGHYDPPLGPMTKYGQRSDNRGWCLN